MTTQEIKKLASQLTEQEINNVIAGWEKDNDTNELTLFNSLVKLGDSRALALATTIANKVNKKDNHEFYTRAYTM